MQLQQHWFFSIDFAIKDKCFFTTFSSSPPPGRRSKLKKLYVHSLQPPQQYSRKVVSILLEDFAWQKKWQSFFLSSSFKNSYFLLCRHDFHPSSISVTLAVEEHKSCRCVDQNSINVTLNVDLRLREVLESQEKEKLSREIRSVAPTISNAVIQTTRATSSAAAHVKSGSSSGSETSATASQAASDMTNGDLAGSVKPTEHEIVYYKTCLACREQQELCRVSNFLRTPIDRRIVVEFGSGIEALERRESESSLDRYSRYSFNQSIKIFSRTTSKQLRTLIFCIPQCALQEKFSIFFY